MPGVVAGIKGVILGEILGRKAGDMAAEFVPCRFLPDRILALDSGLLGMSGESTDGVMAAVLGLLKALILADLADIFGVS